MLDGAVRFPADFAARYRAKGYWEDRSVRDVFDEAFERYGDRIALIDGARSVSYAQLNQHAPGKSRRNRTDGFLWTAPGLR